MDGFDIALYVSYGLIIIAALAALILPLIQSFSDPASLVKTAAGVGILLVVFFVGYALSGNEVTPIYTRWNVDATASKWIGGTLITMYIFLAAAILGILVTEVSKVFK